MKDRVIGQILIVLFIIYLNPLMSEAAKLDPIEQSEDVELNEEETNLVENPDALENEKDNLPDVTITINEEGTTDTELNSNIEEVNTSNEENAHLNADTDLYLKNKQEDLDSDQRVKHQNSPEHTSEIGTLLVKLGFSFVEDDPITFDQAIKYFQLYYGLEVTGFVDQTTINKINEILSSPLQKGNRHKDTIELKTNLAVLGYPVPGNGTTLYGPKTEVKVKEFQAANNLVVNGIADEVTLAKIEELLPQAPVLRKGVRHQDVVQLKKDLATLGFAVPGKGTTLYGKETTKQVKSFQSFYGLVANGIADDVTLVKIEELKNGPLFNKMRRQDVKTLKENLGKLGFTVPGNGTTLFGVQTETKVKEFQSYYGLEVTGIVYDDTLEKIEEILSSPLQNGKRHQDTVTLKENLESLGFPVPGNGTTLYGKNTTKVVREFQSYYGLAVNGIADVVTLHKIEEILSSPLQNGKRHPHTSQLKKDLAKLDFAVPGNGTNLYGTKTEGKVKEFQSYFGLRVNGIADEVTLAKIEEVLSSPLQNGKRHKDTIKLKKDLAKLGYKVSNNPTTLYGDKTEAQVKKFQADHGLRVSGIADEVTLATIQKELSRSIRIFLDPGHGGHDNGASGFGLREKDVVLDIALRTAEVLTEKYIGVDVKLSRQTDKYIGLEDRAKMANDWGADYFVSFHSNAYNGSARGFESFIHNGKVSKTTKEKQQQMHEYLINKLGVTDRGMKRANFSVLRNTNMPAILLEFLFIDNINENRLLKEKSYRNWLGQITAEAIAYAFNLKKK